MRCYVGGLRQRERITFPPIYMLRKGLSVGGQGRTRPHGKDAVSASLIKTTNENKVRTQSPDQLQKDDGDAGTASLPERLAQPRRSVQHSARLELCHLRPIRPNINWPVSPLPKVD